MTHIYALIAVGTAATLSAIALVLLRLHVDGRRPALALVRRWVATGTNTSALVIVVTAAIAAFSFASIPATGPNNLEPVAASAHPTESPAVASDENSDQAALDALRAFTRTIDPGSQSTAPNSTATETASLPDVETMISTLVSRLEEEPGDVKGWKMLGWSYLNTERPTDAERAYETARRIDPNDSEIQKGLEAAKAAQAASTATTKR